MTVLGQVYKLLKINHKPHYLSDEEQKRQIKRMEFDQHILMDITHNQLSLEYINSQKNHARQQTDESRKEMITTYSVLRKYYYTKLKEYMDE